MTLTNSSKERLQYECDKCKKVVSGGIHPTGFCFDQAEGNKHLCLPCYELFYSLQKDFINEFLAEPPEESL